MNQTLSSRRPGCCSGTSPRRTRSARASSRQIQDSSVARRGDAATNEATNFSLTESCAHGQGEVQRGVSCQCTRPLFLLLTRVIAITSKADTNHGAGQCSSASLLVLAGFLSPQMGSVIAHVAYKYAAVACSFSAPLGCLLPLARDILRVFGQPCRCASSLWRLSTNVQCNGCPAPSPSSTPRVFGACDVQREHVLPIHPAGHERLDFDSQ